MPQALNKLSNTAVQQAKPKKKDFKLSDGGGLFLFVKTSGAKYWRIAYRYQRAQKVFAIGVFPEVSLKEAREKRDEVRKLLANNIDPNQEKKKLRNIKEIEATNTFEAVTLEWIEKESHLALDTIKRNKSLLENNLFPWLGSRPISDITPMELLDVLKRVEKTGRIETAHRLRQMSGKIFRYAVITERASRDITYDLQGALKVPKEKHFAALVEPKQVGKLMRDIYEYKGTLVVCAALKVSAYLFQRPGEIRRMRWEEINFQAAEWQYRVTKTDVQHIVPLANQVVMILKELQPFTHRRGEFVFPSARGANHPMSENAVRVALRDMGYSNEQMTPHGFRAMARTILDEVLGYRIDWIEHQLAHAVRDSTGRAYNRTTHLEGRKQMMQGWADYLDLLREGEKCE